VLQERTFARYLAAVTVSTLGSGLAMVALAFAVLEFGDATDLGIVLLAREIPMVVFLLLGGVFADRLPRRTILVSSDLVKGAAQVGTATLLFSGAADVWNVASRSVEQPVRSPRVSRRSVARQARAGVMPRAISSGDAPPG
jgi:MFS family permease